MCKASGRMHVGLCEGYAVQVGKVTLLFASDSNVIAC